MPHKILIADDEPSILEVLEARLESVGYEVHKANDGQEALEKFEQIKPDLAILDVHVLKNLHEFRVIKKIPDPVTRKQYLNIENKMKRFSSEIGIPLIELDLLLWYSETGRIVK